ncbi:protein FAM81B isoform X2 [Denticeps clupeoides]|uniref:Protein FAM81B n=1 Tax=Denticeps clupeoides TaxID=299321 RepID=A0AAY4AI40_9TELE|nr:protein FAM81B isoform X2 [Denticeps clupeoides]XP_028816319.1 protein FAM81B isoform X2 [Denticeps clupeoides]XP_028817008.1 protein FAM81B isoform X2 [Denticeps clupeoides]XP_028817881.1 protein FAM81B isoform X2 [Denticeps clupeoides]
MSQETTIQSFGPIPDKPAHLSGQDRMLAMLLEQALHIKEDMTTSLQATQGSVVMEATSRRLLENHVHTITHIVKQLSRDIQALEAQISQRDRLASGTSLAVQSLDQKNQAGIGDLRGRVARCDASITSLAGELGVVRMEVQKLQKEVQEIRSILELRLKDTDFKLSQAVMKMENTQATQVLSHSCTTTDLSKDIQHLDVKTGGRVRELQGEIGRLRRWTEERIQNSECTHLQSREQTQMLLHKQMGEMEVKIREKLSLFSARVEEVQVQLQRVLATNRNKHSESKLSTRLATVESSLRQELNRVIKEYQAGFQVVHDAIESLKQIGDAQATMDRERLQRDLRQIHKKMVALEDA